MCTLSLSCESSVCNVHFVQCSLCAICTVCNLHCVCGSQLSVSHQWLLTHPTDPFPTVLWTIHPLHIARCNGPLCRKNDFCSKSHHAKMLYLCLVLVMASLESLRRDSNTFHNQLYCQKHVKQNNGLRKYPYSPRDISSTTDLTLVPEPCIRNPVEVAERQHCLFGGLSAPGQDLLHLGSLVK